MFVLFVGTDTSFLVTKIKGIANEICRLHRYTGPRIYVNVGGMVENQGIWTAAKFCSRATFCWFFISHVSVAKKKKRKIALAVHIEQTISLLICANWFERLKCAVIDTHSHTKPCTHTHTHRHTRAQIPIRAFKQFIWKLILTFLLWLLQKKKVTKKKQNGK